MQTVRILYETFRVGGEAYIQRAVNEAMSESLYLDFKLLENNSAPMTVKDKQSLAAAISGFANSDGGIIVWGVYAKSAGPTDPDVAKYKRSIGNLPQFLSDLHVLSGQVVSPGVLGIEHAPLPDSPSGDCGYAVPLVPRSDHDIHRAVAKDQHRYYYRTCTSLLMMEAYMVADRYGRRPQPRLRLEHTVGLSSYAKGTLEIPRTIQI